MTRTDANVPTGPITDESAWLGADLERDNSWQHRLTTAYLREIDDALAAVRRRGGTLGNLTLEDFPFPTFRLFMAEFLWKDIARRGFGVIRGLPLEKYAQEEIDIIYWGIGLHMGSPVSQNPNGDRLFHVTKATKTSALNPAEARLNFHCDPSDVVGFMCLRTAKEGGLSSLVSAASIFNIVLAEHPEYLAILFRGFRFNRANQPSFLPSVSELVPIFSFMDGQLSMRFVRSVINAAAAKLNQPLSEEERAALDFVTSAAHREGVYLSTGLREGDMQFANNHMVMHSRTSFIDHDEPERRRDLLRIWLKVPGIRNLDPAFIEYDDASGWSRREGVLPRDAAMPNSLAAGAVR